MHTYSSGLLEKEHRKETSGNQAASVFIKKKRRSSLFAALILITIMLILNIISWVSVGFSDWYAGNVFPVINNTVTKLTGAIPFSLGEILIVLGILILLVGPLSFIICMIILKKRRKKILRFTGMFLLWVFTYIFVTETMNCFIMYHCTPVTETLYGEKSEYDFEQLVQLGEIVIDGVNYYSAQVERDQNGRVIVPDNLYDKAENAMNNISNIFPMLKGYYPDAKVMIFSDLATQMDLAGVYYPFTLEANYNANMYPTNYADTICHEYSHLKGFIQEDEANFLSYVACISYDNDYFRYCGYLSAFNYVLGEIRTCGDQETINRIWSLVDEQVWEDNVFVEQSIIDEIEEKSIFTSEKASAFSDTAIDTSLKLNGVSDGKQSYGRMVNLLLDFYFSEQ